jgi:tight adherence protein B
VTPTIFWLGRGTLALAVCALLAAGKLAFGGPEAGGFALFSRYLESLDKNLQFLRVRMTARKLVSLQVLGALVLVLAALLLGRWLPVSIVPVLMLGPSVVLERQRAKRVAKIEQQVEGWLVAISNALKASGSLGEAIASTTSLIGAPMSEEIDVLVKEYDLGTPLDRALDNLADRVGSKTLSGAVLALNVARKSGGNLPEMLANAAAALRELARLEGVVRSKTAEGKAQTFVIGVIPVPMVLVIHWIDPEFFAPLQQSFVGYVIVAIACVLWLVAILAARKIVAIDV